VIVEFTVGTLNPKWVFGETVNSDGMTAPGGALIQSSLSLAYVQVDVTAKAAGVIYDPTSDVVQFAFPVVGTDPVGGDWQTGSWTTDVGTGRYLAQCLVGPGGTVTLDRGTYAVWVKITDSPEVPVMQVGAIQIV